MRNTAILLCGSIVLALGCRKEDVPGTEEASCLVDHAFVEHLIVPLYPLARALAIGPGHWTVDSADFCLRLDSLVGDTTAFPANGPVTLHLRFLPGCTDVSGQVRTGTFLLRCDSVTEGRARIAGFSTPDLDVDGIRLRCGASVGAVPDGRERVRLDSSAVWRLGAWSRRLRGDLDHQRTAGQVDNLPQDDVYAVRVAVIGQDRNGIAYTASTTTDLEVATGCRWVRAGATALVLGDDRDRRIDHGSGCDDRADLYVDDTRFGLQLP